MTAATGNYQEWQSRIAYYHYKKQKRLNPCSDLGGFTRLFNTPGAKPDRLMDEIPTLMVHQLSPGRCDECDHGFIVMNRPWGVVQLVESEFFSSGIAEPWILLTETDHMMMRPPPNEATEEVPVGFGFYYMTAKDPKLEPVVKQFLDPSIDTATVDAVGPSPLIIHKPMLKRLARPWWELSLKMKGDLSANRIFGWVLEMWGYNLAARNLGIRHLVSKDIQVEPQGVGTDDMDGKYIYHYTFGLNIPSEKGRWMLDKRSYYGQYPRDHLPAPPVCSARSGFIMRELFQEAAQGIDGWPNRIEAPADDSLSGTPLTQLLRRQGEGGGLLPERLRGTGPWKWGSITSLYLFSSGLAFVASGSTRVTMPMGRWWAAVDDPKQARIELCDAVYRLHFDDPEAPWTFRATTEGGEARAAGSLSSTTQRSTHMLPLLPSLPVSRFGARGANGSLAAELAGSGPWQWAGTGPFGFMRGGELITPWGTGTWGVSRQMGAETAADDTIFADFANSQHTIRVYDRPCLRLTSARKADGEKVGVDFVPLFEGQARDCRSQFDAMVLQT